MAKTVKRNADLGMAAVLGNKGVRKLYSDSRGVQYAKLDNGMVVNAARLFPALDELEIAYAASKAAR